MKKKLFAGLLTIFTAVSMSPFAAFAAKTSASSSSSASQQQCSWGSIVLMVLLFVVMWFFMIRPQKKKEKESKNMQDSVAVGDEIVTIGGIVGLVIKTGDDNVVIETGGDRHRIRIKKWAIQENLTVNEKVQAENVKKAQEKKSLFGGKNKKDSESDAK